MARGRGRGYAWTPPATRTQTQVTESQTESPADQEAVVVLCTAPDDGPAETLARMLVQERLAACVNRIPGVVSNFRWEGRVEEDREVLLVIKSTRGRLAALTARIKALHPYELPEVVAVPVIGGLDAYLGWVRDSVASEPDT